MKAGLYIVPLGPIPSDPELPGWLAHELTAELAIQTETLPARDIDDDWRSAWPGRLDSARLLDGLAALWESGGISLWEELQGGRRPGVIGCTPRVLAITEADLMGPNGTYVFGESTVGGPIAVVSLNRLRGGGVSLLRLRALKESLHEIGHLAGLGHCEKEHCIMSLSQSVATVDRRIAAFCATCSAALPGIHPP